MGSEIDNLRKSQALVAETLARQVAVLIVSGVTSPKELQKRVPGDLSYEKIRAIMASDECRAAVEEITGPMVQSAKLALKRGMADLVPQTINVVKKHLEDDNLNAVPMVFKALQIEQVDQKSGDTRIIVNLPSGAAEPKEAITIKGDE